MKCLRHIGLVFSLLIVGVVGGLMAPLPSEAVTLEIDGVPVDNLTPYACEAGYNICAYITTGSLVRRTVNNTWYVDDISSGNRARVRIQDLGGVGGSANIDKMNITGIKLTPINAASTTTHVKIIHTYATGQAAGDYHWGMGVTGQFDPPGSTNVVGDHFILTGSGNFGGSIVNLGTLNRGAITVSPGAGINGPVTQSIAPRSVKNPCNTGDNFCKPTVTYDLQITSVGNDALVLTDSGIAVGLSVPEGEDCTKKPAGPICRLLKKAGAVLVDDARKGSNAPTCVDTSTCGTIVIKKTIAAEYDFGGSGSGGGACGQGRLCPNTPIVLPTDQTQTFNFDGTGIGIYPFDISITDVVPTGSYSLDFLDTTTASGTRIIRETGFPAAPFPPTTCTPANPCPNFVYWFTKTVSCTPASGGPEGFVYTTHNGLNNLNQNLDGTLQRSGYVEVTSLAVNPAELTCTFENGIFEFRQ